MLQILTGDAFNMLRTLPDESVNCCVTSPPYYYLRDYGVDGQIGLESTPEQYIEKLVSVFREVRRVLRSDGVCFVNIGDSYAGGGGASGHNADTMNLGAKTADYGAVKSGGKRYGLKPKDLIGIPWMLAFALRADGWYLRQDIIWAKPNPMPESVTDRCTKSHEYIFLLTKSARYWYDAEAVSEISVDPESYTGRRKRNAPSMAKHDIKNLKNAGSILEDGTLKSGQIYENRNRRSVWSITTKPFKGAHFATFPPELPRICIMAGCPVGGVVLDPFAGSGTTGAVAIELGRRAVLIELNEKYVDMIKRRTKTTIGMAL